MYIYINLIKNKKINTFINQICIFILIIFRFVFLPIKLSIPGCSQNSGFVLVVFAAAPSFLYIFKLELLAIDVTKDVACDAIGRFSSKKNLLLTKTS